MTIPRLNEMNAYWAKYPPIHLMLASFFGVKPPPKKTDEGSIEEFVSIFQASGGIVNG